MADYKPKSARPYMPRSARPVAAEPQVGAGETFLNRAVGMVPLARPVVDTLSAGAAAGARAVGEAAPEAARFMASLPVVGALAPVAGPGAKLTPQAEAELQAMGQSTAEPEAPGVLDTYRTIRDTRAARTELGSQQNPWAGRAGALAGFGLSLLAPGPKGSGGLGGAMKQGAAYGGLAGLTESKADLTRGEVGQAALDTVIGAGLGMGAGASGYGLMSLGQRGVRALRNAREETLAQETLAAREGAEQAQAVLAKDVAEHRDMVGQARGMMQKDFAKRDAQHGQALEMNKARARRDPKQVLAEARGQNVAVADPDTAVLEGLRGKAGERWGAQDPRLQAYMRELQDPALPAARRERIQQYVDQHRLAFDDPAAFERQIIERYLRERFPNDPQRVARIMSERVGPKAQILPRPAVAPVDEVTAPMGLSDVARQGRAQEVARQGGGGSAFQAWGDDARTVAAPAEELPGPLPSLAEEAEAAMAARRAAAAGADVGMGRAPAPPPPSAEGWATPSKVSMLRRQVQREVGDAVPHWQQPRAPGERRLTAYENADIDYQPGLDDSDATEIAYGMFGRRPLQRQLVNDDALVVESAAAGAPVRQAPLTQPPAVREGVMLYRAGSNQRPAAFSQEPTVGGGGAAPAPMLHEVSSSMRAPVDAPLPPEPATRATNVPDLRRTVPLPPPTPAAAPAAPAAPRPPAPVAPPIQEATRLAGPGDVGPLAAERAAARESGAMGAVARAGYEGVRSGNSILGAVVGGMAGLRKEALQDPAVRARVLAAAKVELLARLSPEVFARLGAPLAQAATSSEGQYNAVRYVYARRDPKFREAEARAASEASRMSDEQLMDLLAGPAQ